MFPTAAGMRICRVGDDGVLTIPDFDGNLFFATLGNILLNGKAGLLFRGFHHRRSAADEGKAEVIFDSPEITAFQVRSRFWTFKGRHGSYVAAMHWR